MGGGKGAAGDPGPAAFASGGNWNPAASTAAKAGFALSTGVPQPRLASTSRTEPDGGYGKTAAQPGLFNPSGVMQESATYELGPLSASGRGYTKLNVAKTVLKTRKFEEEAVNMRTSQDVIEYYVRHGHSADIKVFHLNQADTGDRFRPYDLVVVARDKVLREHFTISASGVVKVVDGHQSEFTPLNEWMRDESIFNLLTQMRFYKYYLIGKLFNIWRSNVRFKLYDQVREKLTQKLFLAKPTFVSTVMELGSIVYDVSETKVTDIHPAHQYNLDEFVEIQHNHRTQKAAPALESNVERLQRVLERIAKEVVTQEKQYRASVEGELGDQTGITLMPGRGASKTKSMVAIKKEKIERAKTYKRVAEEAKMLGSLIRLADYMLVEAVVNLTIKTTADLLSLLETPNKSSKGMFVTTVNFVDDGILFNPMESDMGKAMNGNVMEGLLSMVNAVPRLIFMRSFSVFFEDKLNGPNPLSIIQSTPTFLRLRSDIDRVVSSSFEQAAEYAKIFEEQRVIYNFGKSWDPDQEHGDKTVGQFRKDMQCQKEWRNEVERMKMGHVVGVLNVDSRAMRSSLSVITSKALDALKGQLVVAARDETLRVLERMLNRNKALQDRPDKLDGFTTFMELTEEMTLNKKRHTSEAEVVIEMYEMLGSYDQKVPTTDSVKHDDLKESMATFSNKLAEAAEHIEEYKSSMVLNLDNNIRDVNEQCLSLLAQLHSGPYVMPESDPKTVLVDLEIIRDNVQQMRNTSDIYRRYQQLFKLPADDFSNLNMTEKESNVRYTTWLTLSEWQDHVVEWMTGKVDQLDLEAINKAVDDYSLNTYKMMKANKDDRVVYRIKDEIDDFKQYLPLLQELANPALKPRHWEQVFRLLEPLPSQANRAYHKDLDFSIQDLIDFEIMGKMEAVSVIGGTASKEYSLQKSLEKMTQEWAGMELKLIAYKETGTHIIGGVDEVQAILDDQIVKIQSMNASPFMKPFKEEGSEWEATLRNLQDMLDNWLKCQSTWLYLEPIFSSEDIVKQMPEEGAKFQTVDSIWRSIMSKTLAQPDVIQVARDVERLDQLQQANVMLDAVQKGLAAYLEKKRLFFPRFFFLSNDEMLEILSETKDPLRVQPHLKKAFEGVDSLRFEKDLKITALVSVEKEEVPLKTLVDPVKANGAVEKWLLQVEAAMFESVQDATRKSVIAYAENEREKWVLQWPGMVVLVVTAVYWTREVAAAIQAGTAEVAKYEKQCTSQLMNIVGLVRGELTKLQRATLGALVVMDVHARDVVTTLAKEGVTDPNEFSWQSQLRSYWEDDDTIMRMMNAEIKYGYEYLGNSSRLVITPLTDRCYRTLMGAIHLTLGGAPEGPAGTGKTETTKDLAKALARQCVVFNCSDSLDYIAMGKFFKGLASSGAWACFDEFNRIDLEVLSVVAQQVLDIQRAIGAKVKTFVFEGTEMQLRVSAWCAITMNPGYAGRSELPDNLKALFRTVAMMVPDYAMISEIILYSFGYLQARECAQKIVATYKLCSEQLSSQDHYDYGMRAVIAVLRAAGNLKRTYPSEDEYVLMLRSIIDVNLCKFLSQDVPLFEGIVGDLFPGVVLPEPDYTDLVAAIQDNCVKMNLQAAPYFIQKIIQLYEMIIVRHGLMLVGLSFSAKTRAYRILAAALTDMKNKGLSGPITEVCEYHVLNPKSITMGQLYGNFDPVSHEWTDGILAVTFRSCASDPSPNRKWVLFDGPVDAIWIENMNTVLDDNKKLCLMNSEIIQMSSSMNMIFEVADLAVASPATVSRCGMVYLEPHQLGWRPLTVSWINTLPPAFPADQKEHLLGLFDFLVPATLKYVRRVIREAAPTYDTNLVQSLQNIFACHLDAFTEEVPLVLSAADARTFVDMCFMFSLIWSIGATSSMAEGRNGFDKFLRALVAGNVDPDYKEFVKDDHVAYASPMVPAADEGSEATRTVFEYYLETGHIKWAKWTDLIDDTPIPPDAQFRDIIIPTIDTVRYTFLLDVTVKHDKPILFVGPTGTGKSVYVSKHLMRGLDAEKFIPNFVSFSARTTSNQTQSLIESKLDKRRRGVYGPRVGTKCVIFVDDLNMPARENYGAQPPIELLRQFMDHGGWYDRENAFRQLVDVQFVAAMGPPGGGRSPVTGRYQRHFNLISIVDFDEQTLTLIFDKILEWYLSSRDFPANVRDMKNNVIQSTMNVYKTAISQLLPTPSKSHYTFNLRDVSRVIQGMLLQPRTAISNGAAARGEHLRLWVHEVMRIFYDRLVDDQDRSWFLEFVKSICEGKFKENFNQLFQHLDASGDGSVDAEELRGCFFGDYMNSEVDQRMYTEIKDIKTLILKMEEYLVDYNGMSKRPMNLAMFLYAVEHVSRICRVLKQPGAHMLLAGVGGSGRQSLSRLAAFISGMKTFQIEISKSYTKVEWRDDLKKMMRAAGSEGVQTVFLFSDTQIKEESFVEDINNILNSGEVPSMFAFDEKASIIETVRPIAKKAGKKNIESSAELWAYFVELCKNNLHIVLCFSPIGEAFRERLRQFPSLVNCCTIDWFQQWPNDALEAVAQKFLKEVNLENETRSKLVDMCKIFHKTVRQLSIDFKEDVGRYNYVTPMSYLELLTMFTTLLTTKRQEVATQQKRYEVGLEKLDFTAKQVVIMQNELTALKPNLIKTVAETEQLMAQVKHEKEDVVEPKKAIVDKEVSEAKVQGDAANAIKVECESALAEAIPVLESALAALDTLKPADIKLVQSFKSPPATIKLVMEAICVCLDIKPAKVQDPTGSGKKIDDYWEPSKKVLGESDFMQRLKNYDKDNIPVRIIDTIRKTYIANPDFTPANAAKASSAAEGLCKWVCAMDQYDKVAKVVAPKRAALAEAESSYNTVMAGLKIKQAELKELMDKVANLEALLSSSVIKKQQLETDVEICTQKLERAEKLINGLGGEKDRWTIAALQLSEQFNNLTGDMLISAGVIGYLGAFTMSYRTKTAVAWVSECKKFGIPSSPVFSLNAALGNAVKIREWAIAGLPNDSFSVDNGIMVANARRWPLMIDPQGQANKWVKNMERSANLQVCKLTDGDYLRTLENAIQFGLPVLLENVGEELDPSLEPLLLKQIFKQGGVMCIRLGDSTIEYSDAFRFYITTTLRNPHYLPETAVKVTLLNFMITLEGLGDQLLGVVVAEERPDLAEARNALIVQSADNKRKLKEIEDRILHVLSSSQGNILEDASAIQILSEAKLVSDDINAKQQAAEETEREIDAVRAGYKPCGEYNAVLFFCISDLGNVDPMYQYSLNWFVKLFIRAIHESDKSEDLIKRLDIINAFFTYSLYMNVCRSLFEKDKLLFSFLLAVRILGAKGEIDESENMFLLTGGVGGPDPPPNPAAMWLQDSKWAEVVRLSTLKAFVGLAEDFKSQEKDWKKVYDSSEPHKDIFPGRWGRQGGAFQRLLLLRCIRPDKIVPAVNDYVAEKMGPKFIEPPPFDLAGSYAESSAVSPLLFVLSPGSDPTAALLKFAEEKGFGTRISAISMGQGQGPKAAAIIAEAVRQGTWVLLQNCHLAASWMPALEKICEGIKPDNSNPDFRLWMTSYPSTSFPISILQNGVKMTNEPPAGIRANLKRSFMLDPIVNREFFEGCNKPGAFKKLVFGLCFVHAFVQERRKFGAMGWNIPYGFDDGDLRISVRQLQMYLNGAEKVPFVALRYATGECNYGGRVTDDKDRRLLNTVLELVYREEILKDGNKLSASGTYFAPPEGPYESYIEYINKLPIVSQPEAFGLHENADIAKDQSETALMFESILLTGGGSGGGGGGGGNTEAIVGDLAKDMLKRLPPNFDMERVEGKYPVRYEESMNQVLCQEMLRFNKLTDVIRTSLQQLEKAVAGLLVMSSELERVFRSVSVGQVPQLWKGASFPSLKPLASYILELLERLDMLQKWYENGMPPVYWISGFFFTPAFTTAALQNYARRLKLPIDTVAFDYEFLDVEHAQYTTAPQDGVYVRGLFLEGCAWDEEKRVLCESKPKVLAVPAPVIWLRPKMLKDFNEYKHYNCPVYRTADRRGVLATTGHSTNFLMFIRMPSQQDEHHWTLRGVCLLSSLPA